MSELLEDRYVNQKEALRFLGDVSHMFIRRRLADPASDFPKPRYLGNRPVWLLSELKAWANKSVAPSPGPANNPINEVARKQRAEKTA